MEGRNTPYRIRLGNEYMEIQRIPENDMVEIRPAPGETPPYVSRYHVTYNIPTWVRNGEQIVKQARTVVEISQRGFQYPPHAVVIEGRPPFHPNWYEQSGLADNGCFWRLDRWLYEYIVYYGEMLQFRRERMSFASPSNNRARDFWMANLNDERLIPTDTRPIPAPPEKNGPKIL